MMELSPGFDRIPPQALESEQAALGCILLDSGRSALESVSELLEPGDFYRDAHRRIYEAMLALDGRGEPTDLLMVSQELERMGMLDFAGGRPYLVACIEAVPATTRAASYARAVRDAATLRRLIDAGGKIIGMAYEQDEPAEAIAAQAERMVAAVAARRDAEGPVAIGRVTREIWDQASAAAESDVHTCGVPSGIPDLDRMTGGWQAPRFILLAARTSQGKTSCGVQFWEAAGMSGRGPALLFTLEDDRYAVGLRLLARRARLETEAIRSGRLSSDSALGDEWGRLRDGVVQVGSLPLYVDDTPALSAGQMRTRARRLQAERGLSLIVVDYLGMIASGGRYENAQVEMAARSRALKALARELSVPVLGLAQLSREVERREKKKPVLADLRESGALEQDADQVLMFYRPAYYDDMEVQDVERCELLVRKNRMGPTGAVPLVFVRRFAYFRAPTMDGGEPEEGWDGV